MTCSDPEYVRRQYRDPSNLNASIALHERFSTSFYGLTCWIFDQFELASRGAIHITKDVGTFVARK